MAMNLHDNGRTHYISMAHWQFSVLGPLQMLPDESTSPSLGYGARGSSIFLNPILSYLKSVPFFSRTTGIFSFFVYWMVIYCNISGMTLTKTDVFIGSKGLNLRRARLKRHANMFSFHSFIWGRANGDI